MHDALSPHLKSSDPAPEILSLEISILRVARNRMVGEVVVAQMSIFKALPYGAGIVGPLNLLMIPYAFPAPFALNFVTRSDA